MAPNGIRQGHVGGFIVRQLHITLAVGFALVACLTAFGGGVIVGMWYKVGDQPAPLGTAVSAPNSEQSGPSQGVAPPQVDAQTPVTFYNTLTNNSVAYAPLTPPSAPAVPAAPAVPKGMGLPSPAAPVGAPGGTKTEAASAVVARGTPLSVTPDSPKAVPTAKSVPTSAAAAAEKRARPGGGVSSSVSKPAKPTPPPSKAVVAGSATPAARAKTALVAAQTTQKPAPAVRQAAKAPPTQQPASAEGVKVAKAASTEDFSVQVGSFGGSEQAERLRSTLSQKGYPARVQLSSVPGQGLRYRVRVGNYAERTAANQSAQHLTVQEQVPAIVAGKD